MAILDTDSVTAALEQPKLSDRLAALRFYVDLANSERQAIWVRHSTMIVGNSFIVGAIKSDPAAGPSWLSGAGLCLCVAWAVITWVGWGWFYTVMRESKLVLSDPVLNPFAGIENLGRRRRDTVFICAMVVIAIFSSVYVADLSPHFKHWIALLCNRI